MNDKRPILAPLFVCDGDDCDGALPAADLLWHDGDGDQHPPGWFCEYCRDEYRYCESACPQCKHFAGEPRRSLDEEIVERLGADRWTIFSEEKP